MSISKSDREIISKKLKVQRDEPKVKHTSPAAPGTEQEEIVLRDQFLDAVYNSQLLYGAFYLVSQELAMLEKSILAKMKLANMSLLPEDLTESELEALKRLNGGGIVTPDVFRDMLDTERQVGAKIVSDTVRNGDLSALNNIEDLNINEDYKKAMPIIGPIGDIKKAFRRKMVDREFFDGLLLESVVADQSIAGEMMATIQQLYDTPFGKIEFDEPEFNITDDNDDDSSSGGSRGDAKTLTTAAAQKQEQASDVWADFKANNRNIAVYIEQCIPCHQRILDLPNNVMNHIERFNIVEVLSRILYSMLNHLMHYKQHLGRFYFMTDACRMFNLLFNTICIPDFMTIIALFKILLGKLKFDLKLPKIDISWMALADLIIGPVLSAIFAMITGIMSSIMSPIHCLRDYLSIEIRKIGGLTKGIREGLEAGGNEYEADFGTELFGGDTAFAQYVTFPDMLVKYIGEGTEYLDELIASISATLNKFRASHTVATLNDIFNIKDASMLTMYVGMLNDILVVAQTIDDLTDGNNDSTGLCERVLSRAAPLDALINSMQIDIDKFIKDLTDDLGDLFSDKDDDEAKKGLISENINKETIIESNMGFIADATLPSDFMKGFDIEEALTIPLLKDIFNKDESNPIEGEDVFKPSEGDIKQYIATKRFAQAINNVFNQQDLYGAANIPEGSFISVVGAPAQCFDGLGMSSSEIERILDGLR